MGFLSSSISVTRFNVVVPPEGPDFERIQFWAIDPNSEVRERIGVIPFEIEAPYEVGQGRYAFRVRIDRIRADATAVKGNGDGAVFTRPMFQGKVSADVVLEGPAPHLVTMQIGAMRADAVKKGSAPAAVRTVAAAVDPSEIRQKPEAPFREAKQSVDLTQAERIVAVGRGIKGQEHVQVAQQLADALGAELAASRPICDAGWLPMERQIGSSGQTVAPKLYLALGISGAIQHVVGMKGARTIVAINKDAEAPIFEIADYGIVGDLFEVIPAMIAELQK
jgi:electron transfer flavoprotein alpha subunit